MAKDEYVKVSNLLDNLLDEGLKSSGLHYYKISFLGACSSFYAHGCYYYYMEATNSALSDELNLSHLYKCQTLVNINCL